MRCTTGEAFTNEFLGALSGGHTDGFKASFRDVDVLLVDDVQFLERKAKTEEEFFHTFNALYDAGRQIVLSSDRPPRDLQALEDRLRERFEAGLVADIKPPELATRLAILRKRAHHDGIELADTRRPAGDRRARHAERARARGRPDPRRRLQLADRTRADRRTRARGARRPLPGERALRAPAAKSVGEIQAAVGEHFGLTPRSSSRPPAPRRIAWPRQVAMYLARELTGESLPAIGRHFGGRDHTTVLHAWRRTSARILADDASREAVEKLCSQLGCELRSPSRDPDRAA